MCNSRHDENCFSRINRENCNYRCDGNCFSRINGGKCKSCCDENLLGKKENQIPDAGS